MTDSNWQQFGEFKMVLNLTQVMTTMTQYKEQYVSSCGQIVKSITYNNLTAGELRIIVQNEVTTDPNISQNISDVDLITSTGA